MEKEDRRQESAINLVIIEKGCDFWRGEINCGCGCGRV